MGCISSVRRAVGLRTRVLALAPALAGARRQLPSGTNAVAITFDDGPDPLYTARILDELAANGARATFFCVGALVESHPELVRRMRDEGHAVGSHSQNHHYSDTLTLRTRIREFRAGRRSLEAVTGVPVRLFRPPHGKIDYRTAIAIRVARLRPWLWSVDPGDWRPGSETGAITRDVAHAVGGDVLVLHDSMCNPVSPEASDRSATVAAIAPIVAGLRARGIGTTVLEDQSDPAG